MALGIYSEFRTAVKSYLADKDNVSNVDATDIDPNIDAALIEHSKRYPARLFADLTGDAVETRFRLNSLTGWIKEFSDVISVEWPVNETPPSILAKKDYAVFGADMNSDATLDEVLYLLSGVPAVAEKVRVIFNGQHTIHASVAASTTVNEMHHRPFCLLAASYCAEAISRTLIRRQDSAVGDDLVNFGTQSGEWSARAKELREKYEKGMQDGIAAIGTSIALDMEAVTGFEPVVQGMGAHLQ